MSLMSQHLVYPPDQRTLRETFAERDTRALGFRGAPEAEQRFHTQGLAFFSEPS